jgi:hypothetical protein
VTKTIPDPNFGWIVGEVQSDSAERLEKMKDDMKKVKLALYKGEM